MRTQMFSSPTPGQSWSLFSSSNSLICRCDKCVATMSCIPFVVTIRCKCLILGSIYSWGFSHHQILYYQSTFGGLLDTPQLQSHRFFSCHSGSIGKRGSRGPSED